MSILTLSLVGISFLLGSIPSGYILGRLYGVDVRAHGSGNIGATNAARVLGKRAGVITLIADVVKGILAASIVVRLPEFLGLHTTTDFGVEPWIGIAALFGHCFSPFLKWKGGKGVATGLGVFLVLCPKATLLAVLVFLLIAKLLHYVSLGSLGAALTLVLVVATNITGERSTNLTLAALVAVALIFYRHKSNLSRLMGGKELRATPERTN